MLKRILGRLACLLCLVLSVHSFAESLTDSVDVNATMVVQGKITIENKRDLKFTSAVVGAKEETVKPEDNGSALLKVAGDKGQGFQVAYSSNEFFMFLTGVDQNAATADQKIKVSSLTTNLPSATNGGNPSGTLDNNGETNFNLGATRAALSSTQATGSYAGKVTLTVSYL